MHSTDWLHARAAASPAAVALYMDEKSWSYGELDRLVDRLCVYLHARGVAAGDFMAMLLPAGRDAVCLVHAAARLGVVLVPLNGRLTPTELSWQLNHTRAAWLVTTPDLDPQSENAGGRQTVFLEEKWPEQPADPFPRRGWAAEQLQAVIFTSGTTGQPKGAMISYGSHFYSAMGSAYRLGLDPADIWLSCLPLYHVGGLAVLFRSCLYGTAVDLHPRFDIAAIQRSFTRRPITLISLVPTMLHRLLAAETVWPQSMRLILLGGAAAPPELLAQAREKGLPVAPTYGLTEAASQVATMPPAAAARKPGSVGKPLLFSHVRILDRQGKPLSAGSYGEIVVSGPTLMAGYLHNPTATAQTIQEGELRTGDIGYLDEDGDLWLVQRRSDIIISGGENVYPAEVEQVLRAHPAIAAACVVGVPDPEWGQTVAAMVVRQEEAAVTIFTLQEYCRRTLAGYKIPRIIRFVPDLPQTASGKIHRRQVADIFRKKI